MPNLRPIGVGLLGTLNDMGAADEQRLIANKWHARVTIDFGQGGAAAYWGALERCADHGISLLPILFWTHSDGRPCSPRHHGWNEAWWASQCRLFGNMLADIEHRFPGGAPHQVEIWNEQNTIQFWHETADSAREYAGAMLSPARRELLTTTAGMGLAIVCGGLSFRHWFKDGTWRSYAAEDYVLELKRAGALGLIDRWSIHPYGRTNADGKRVADENISSFLAWEEVRRFKRRLNLLGANKPIWITETGLSVQHALFNERSQNRFLRNFRAKVQESHGLGVTAWSNWPLRDPPAGLPAYYYSGLYRQNGAIRPAGQYWSQAFSQ